MKSVKRRHALHAAVGACCVVASVSAMAEVRAGLDVGATYSDNIGRTRVDEQSEKVATAGVNLGIELDRPRLQTDIGANLQYRDYIDESFDSEVVGGLAGSLTYAFVIDRFLWNFEDNYSQIAADRTQAESPDNRQNVNYFSTGPDLIVPFGARTSGQLSGRWSDTYYEESDEGSNGQFASLAVVRKLTEQSSVSLNGSASKNEYDEENFPDSEVRAGFLNYSAEGTRTTFSTDVGYTEAQRGDDEANGGLLVRLSLSRTLGARTSLRFNAGSEFTDTGTALRLEQDAIGVGSEATDEVAAADVFRNTYAYLTLSTEMSRTTFTAGLRASRERYENEIQLDRDIVGASFGMERRISPRLSLNVDAAYFDEELKVSGFAFDEWSIDAGLVWQLNRAWSLVFGAGHYSGSSDNGVRDYDENRASVNVRYSIGR